jgi:argininosuccinate lyase
MRRVRWIVLAFVLMAFVAGCGTKPQQEIDAATAAMNALISEGLGKYAPEDEKKLKDAMAAVNAELQVQEGKTFKNYDKTKQLLADLTKMVADMKAALPAKKEKAKQAAMAALEAAKAAVADAKKMLAKAPKGKGASADIEALRGDVKGAEEMLPEVQGLIEKEDYNAAMVKANAIKDKAAGVGDQITKALEKVKGAKPPAKK